MSAPQSLYNILTGAETMSVAAGSTFLGDTQVAATTLTGTGTGISGGSGTVVVTRAEHTGTVFESQVLVNIKGLQAIATDGDVIGDSTNAAPVCLLSAAQCGATCFTVLVTCAEAPAGASTDIDFFSASVATAKKDDAMSGVTGQTKLIDAGGAWTNGAVKGATTVPLTTDYLYLANGAGANAGTYTAGKFIIRILGYG